MTAADAVLVLCTAPLAAADGLARQLVEERLCACVNVLPGVRSVFRWQGKVDTADECLLLAKTTRAAAANLRSRLAALHPYDVPEILEVAIDGGLPAYLRWLADAVAGP
ncbi:MAG: divalent-cation tolerance protein CutA [Planctomycetes bacterium]|nr:divalent-cation tolerance protein CutA [Planctomycetota bacterium]